MKGKERRAKASVHLAQGFRNGGRGQLWALQLLILASLEKLNPSYKTSELDFELYQLSGGRGKETLEDRQRDREAER